MDFLHAVWRLLKTIGVFAFELTYLVIARPRTRPERAAWLTRLCARLLRNIDVHVYTHGPVTMKGAVISNHLSFVDILVQGSLRPCVFVANSGVRKLPLLGWMSMMAGTVYVSRGSGGSAETAAQTMAKGFRDGLPVVYYPEGTTGSGEVDAAPFKSGLIAQTMEAREPMTPCFIRYKLSEQDLRKGRTARHSLYWQEQTLPQMIWGLCLLHRLDVSVRFAEHPVDFTAGAVADRKVAAVEARDAMLKLTEPPAL